MFLSGKGLEPAGWIRDLLGLAVAMAGPAFAVLRVRRYLDRRYPKLDQNGVHELNS